MNRHLMTFLAIAILGGASHAWAQKPQPNVLTDAQLKALLSGGLTVTVTGAKPPQGQNTVARSGTAVYQKDGTARFNETPASMTYIGSWRIEGNKFCTNYTQLGKGCFNVQKLGATSYKLLPLDGLLEATWDIVKK